MSCVLEHVRVPPPVQWSVCVCVCVYVHLHVCEGFNRVRSVIWKAALPPGGSVKLGWREIQAGWEREREKHRLLCNRAFLSFVNKQERPVHTHKVSHQILAWESLLQGHAWLVRREVLLYTNTHQNMPRLMFCNKSWTKSLGKEGKVCAKENNWPGCLKEGFLHVPRATNTHRFFNFCKNMNPVWCLYYRLFHGNGPGARARVCPEGFMSKPAFLLT